MKGYALSLCLGGWSLAVGLGVALGADAETIQKRMESLIGAGQVWELTADGFMEEYGELGFRWTSAEKGSARADGKRVALGAFGKRVGETIVLFEGESPKQLQLSFYNRGDDGEISEDQFGKALEFWKEQMTKVTGQTGQSRGKDNKSAVRAEGHLWETETTAYLLEYSEQKRPSYRAEFIRLRTARVVRKSFMEERLAKETRTTRGDLPANVVREEGDVYVSGVPMVDQGEKGYCVVASTARVFGYYGMQVDQHEIAQIANATAEGGTSTVGMIEALDRVAGRFKVRVKTHMAMEYGDMKDLTKDYNRLAKRVGKPTFSEDASTNMWYHFDSFDPEILKETRLRSKADLKKFQSEIERSIQIGVPLLWTVTVGLFPEPKRISQERGGHMRMVVGYNWGKNEVIFSDSWGAGHEMKRWGLEEAFSATKGLYSILPIQ